MILRKRKIPIMAVIIVVMILISSSVLAFLYLKTDMFKSNETLFAKYLVQNLDIIEILKNEDTLGIDKLLNENKYQSEIEGKIEFTENIGTSAENRNNPINDIEIKINSNIDKMIDYTYRNISINNDKQDLVKFEYLNEEQNYGLRLNGIKQFVSINEETVDDILDGVDVQKIENLTSIDISPILNFSEEEKQKLMETYISIMQSKISKDRYYKQSNSLITVNNKDIQANAYGVKLTIEEYNNIIIDILTQISQDEIILSRIDLIENKIKEIYNDYDPEETLRNQFINSIKDTIEEIQDNNIGDEEVRITVYENNQKTVRTSIEKNADKITIDLYDDLSVILKIVKVEDTSKEQYIKIEKDESNNMLVEYGVIQDNEIVNNFKYDYKQTLQENLVNKKIDIEISNLKNKLTFNMVHNIEVVQEFSDEISLDTDNILLNDLNEQQLEAVIAIVMENIETQLTNLGNVISLEDFMEILQNLGYEDNTPSIELPAEGEVSEVEKKRFNAQFEFFVSENLTTNNIKELMEVAENNFEDMKVLLKTGEIQDLDMEQLNSEQDSKSYIDNISEILFFIKSNTSNDEKKDDVFEFLDSSSDNKYNVFLQYDDTGLVRVVRIQIQEEV